MTGTNDGKVKTRLGNTLTRVGAAVGVVGVIAMAIKLKIELSPQAQQVLFYKGLFAAAAVLLILGAWYGREGRQQAREAEAQKANELTPGSGGQLDFSSRPLADRERLDNKL
jgi:hypothetical protein